MTIFLLNMVFDVSWFKIKTRSSELARNVIYLGEVSNFTTIHS